MRSARILEADLYSYLQVCKTPTKMILSCNVVETVQRRRNGGSKNMDLCKIHRHPCVYEMKKQNSLQSIWRKSLANVL